MKLFIDMVRVESRKLLRSRLPLFTALGSLFMPFGMAFLIFIARNPEISKQMGLVSAKADLVAYSATDWPAYLGLYSLILAAGGFILFVLILSWVFGREFVDGTLKDLLAVPVPRGSILLAKFGVAAAWCAALSGLVLAAGLATGVLINLPGGTPEVLLRGCLQVLASAFMTLTVALPFAFFASLGRGYLLPIGMAVLTMMATNMVTIAGWGEYFPWAVVGLFVQGKAQLGAASYLLVAFTGLAGMLITYAWWKYADQSK